jgi:hypothetical protein
MSGKAGHETALATVRNLFETNMIFPLKRPFTEALPP